MRYRCNLGLWTVAVFMVLPFAVFMLLGPGLVAVAEGFAG